MSRSVATLTPLDSHPKCHVMELGPELIAQVAHEARIRGAGAIEVVVPIDPVAAAAEIVVHRAGCAVVAVGL